MNMDLGEESPFTCDQYAEIFGCDVVVDNESNFTIADMCCESCAATPGNTHNVFLFTLESAFEKLYETLLQTFPCFFQISTS